MAISMSGEQGIPITLHNNTNQMTGDFDAELKLTEKLRFKVFNRYNDTYATGLSPYTQGVGSSINRILTGFLIYSGKRTKLL